MPEHPALSGRFPGLEMRRPAMRAWNLLPGPRRRRPSTSLVATTVPGSRCAGPQCCDGSV